MKPTLDAMAMGISKQTFPSKLARVVTIKCSECECEIMQADRGGQFLDLECHHCESFNTVVDRIPKMRHAAHEFFFRVDSLVTPVLLQRRRALMWAMVPLCNQQNQCENYYVKGML
jgi:hypothetical protein